MKSLKQFGLVSIILIAGQAIQKAYSLSIPGTVLGMMILLLLLILKVVKLEKIESITKILLDHLTFLFVPVGVGLITAFDKIKDTWIPLLIISIVSTAIVMGVTGLTVQLLNKYLLKKSRKGA